MTNISASADAAPSQAERDARFFKALLVAFLLTVVAVGLLAVMAGLGLIALIVAVEIGALLFWGLSGHRNMSGPYSEPPVFFEVLPVLATVILVVAGAWWGGRRAFRTLEANERRSAWIAHGFIVTTMTAVISFTALHASGSL